MTKVGEAKISPKWHISLIARARPWLGDPEPGDHIEFHVEDGVVKIRKRTEEKKMSATYVLK